MIDFTYTVYFDHFKLIHPHPEGCNKNTACKYQNETANRENKKVNLYTVYNS